MVRLILEAQSFLALRHRDANGIVLSDLVWAGLVVGTLLAMFSHFGAILLPFISASIFCCAALFMKGDRKQFIINAVIVHVVIAVTLHSHTVWPDSILDLTNITGHQYNDN